MAAKTRRFADDGWAVWISGQDHSTVYFNGWINPKGHSYVDVAVRIYGVLKSDDLNIYVPFHFLPDEFSDLSGFLSEESALRGLFNTNNCTYARMSDYTSELRYNDHVICLLDLSLDYMEFKRLSQGVLIRIDLDRIKNHITCDELYTIFRIPLKSLDRIFAPQIDMKRMLTRMKEAISSPIVSHKYGYSVRINEARLLPQEIGNIRQLHEQCLLKAIVTLSIHEDYMVSSSNCYQIRRMEENLYIDYAPDYYDRTGAITYQWVERRGQHKKSHFNFYFDITYSELSHFSIMIYILIITLTGVVGMYLYDLIRFIFSF